MTSYVEMAVHFVRNGLFFLDSLWGGRLSLVNNKAHQNPNEAMIEKRASSENSEAGSVLRKTDCKYQKLSRYLYRESTIGRSVLAILIMAIALSFNALFPSGVSLYTIFFGRSALDS